MTTLNLGGMQSISLMTGGIDYSQIIQQLTQANRAPGDALNQTLQTDRLQNNDWANVASLAVKVQNDLVDLTNSSTFASYTSTLSGTDASNFTATAGVNAAPGTYDISVTSPLKYGSVTSGAQIGKAVDFMNTSVTSSVFNQPVTTGTTLSVTQGATTTSYTVKSGDTINNILTNLFPSGSNVTWTAGTGSAADTISITNSSTSDITFGTAGDTNMLFAAIGLAGQTVTASGGQKSSGVMGHVQLSQFLGSANLAQSFTYSGAGTISINGVNIDYNTQTDTLQQIINRVNSSNAGVTASYDSIHDTVSLTSKTSQPVSVKDVPTTGNTSQTNNLGAVLGVTSASTTAPTVVTGSAMQYTLNGTTMSSPTSTLTNVIPGVAINVNAPSSAFSGTKTSLDASITVAQDNSSVTTKVKTFVADFNNLYHQLQLYTQKGGDLQGDGAIAQLAFQYMSDVLGPVQVSSAYPQNTTMGIGISNGAIGSAPGTTNTLQIDENTLTSAFTNNPSEVQDILKGMASRLNQDLVNMTGQFNTLYPITSSNIKLTGMAQSQENMYSDMITRTQQQQQTIYDQADQQAQLMQQQFMQLQQYQQQSSVQMNMVRAMSTTTSG
jgi:flagellar hook-associated protein 2